MEMALEYVDETGLDGQMVHDVHSLQRSSACRGGYQRDTGHTSVQHLAVVTVDQTQHQQIVSHRGHTCAL